ncbi:MAG: hypothetical protein LUQ47_01830 [Methanotrichaceae archaeon]|nr:hypothetical protein [Methanotrichaceae archaeon]
MERVYGLISDDILPQVDEAARQEGISRAKWIGIAIASHLHRNGDELHRSDDNGDV